MLDPITIRNFKAIQDLPVNSLEKLDKNSISEEITDDKVYFRNPKESKNNIYLKKPLQLKGLSKINYLVGKNGCGKSSILNAIDSLLIKSTDISNNASTYITSSLGEDKVSIKIKKDLSKLEEIITKKNNSFIETSEIIEVLKFIIDITIILTCLFGFGYINNTYFNNYNLSFFFIILTIVTPILIHPYIQKNIDLLKNLPCNHCKISLYYNVNNAYLINNNELSKIEVDKITNTIFSKIGINIDSFHLENMKYNNFTIPFQDLSDGLKKLVNLIKILHNSKQPIILIEEIENCFNPFLQKLIPVILNLISTDNFKSQIFISTHSPFIISEASKYPNTQKVYLIEDGQTRGLEKNSLGQGQDGFVGGECLLAVNEMLGSTINDIAPHTIIFCENTLKILLTELFKANQPLKPIILTTKAGGSDERIKAMTEIFDMVRQSDNVNFLNYNIFGVIDQIDNAKIWKKQLQEKLIVSNFTELELLYDINLVNEFLLSKNLSAWNRTTCPEFAKDYCETNNIPKDQKGKIKNELAQFMGEKLTKEQLKLFSTELHDCIFS